MVSIKAYAPSPEDILMYEEVNSVQEELNKVQELESQLPTEEEIRSMLADQVAEYRRQMRPVPGRLPHPTFPTEPDWKSIGWDAFAGANLLDSVHARFVPPCISAYDKSPYRNPNKILSSREAHCLDLVEKAELDRLAKEISDKVHPNRSRSSINWKSIGRVTLIIGGTVILTAANVASGGALTPMQVALIAGASGAVIEGGSEIFDELQDGEAINWGTVAARTVGGGAKGAMFSVPGLGTAKLAAGTVGIATAENYLHSAAKGDVSAEALGKALANGTIEGVTAGLVDVAAKKVLGAQTHAEPKPKPELHMQPMSEVEQGSYLRPDIQLFAEKAESMTRVGRWMCREEYEKMVQTGRVQMSSDNKVHVANPANIHAFEKQAFSKSVYVEFDVPSNTVFPGGRDDWAIVAGPGSLNDRLNQYKGLLPIVEMPSAKNIKLVKEKE